MGPHRALPPPLEADIVERVGKVSPASEDNSEDENIRLHSDEAAPAGDAEVLQAAIDNMRQGFMLLDDDWRVKSFNPRLSELIGYPPSVMRVGASARDLVCAAMTLGHYEGCGVEEAYEAWRLRLEDRRPGNHLSRLTNGQTMGITYAPFGKGGWIITYEDISVRI